MILRRSGMTDVETANVNGVEVLTISQFARVTQKSNDVVRQLLCTGNRFRKLKATYVDGRTFIPVSELFDFPFSLPGRNRAILYRYRIVKGEVKSYIQRIDEYLGL